jgi:hypothetical protein
MLPRERRAYRQGFRKTQGVYSHPQSGSRSGDREQLRRRSHCWCWMFTWLRISKQIWRFSNCGASKLFSDQNMMILAFKFWKSKSRNRCVRFEIECRKPSTLKTKISTFPKPYFSSLRNPKIRCRIKICFKIKCYTKISYRISPCDQRFRLNFSSTSPCLAKDLYVPYLRTLI